MRLIDAAALLAAASSSPAFAQTFNGFSITAISGVDHVTAGGINATGIAYGIGAGYDFRSGGAAFGFQLEAADATTKECSAPGCVEAGRDLYAGIRGGAVVGSGGNTLVYGLAGYSNARAQFVGFPGHIDLDGIRVGLGVEHQPGPTPNWYFRVEGRYTNYELGFERWQGIAGVGYRF
jgi:outer membrane immunogenic protein